LFKVPGAIIVRNSVERSLTLEKLKGLRVAVVSNYTAHDVIKNQYPAIQLDVVPNTATGLTKVSFGMVDAYVENLATATYYMQETGISNVHIAGNTPFSYDWGIGIRKDWPELEVILNKGIAAITVEERREVVNRWLPVSQGWRPGKAFIISTVALSVSLLFAAVLAWNRSLQLQVARRTAALNAEIGERRRAEQEIRLLNEVLEDRVNARTAELELEITERQKAQEALVIKQLQLEHLNQSLEIRVNEALAELRQRDQLLIQQGRLAAMGEMINNIAHQWRQPLNNIGLIVQSLRICYDAGKLTAAEMDLEITKAMNLILHMSNTIDDFRNFFRLDKHKQELPIGRLVKRSLDFLSAALNDCQIMVRLDVEEDVTATGYQNEYGQALLNILANAKDALLERKVADPQIIIHVRRENNRSVVTIRDNGGGIAEEILPKIFDPYFTTKEPNKGTGIGLYMSKVIIEQNMGGRLTARNVDEGVEFRIEL
jgi:C4-dicarboxylate-specific signal transduction histidine kinase